MGSHSEEKNPLSLCFKVKEKTEWNGPAGYSVMCGSEGEGELCPF